MEGARSQEELEDIMDQLKDIKDLGSLYQKLGVDPTLCRCFDPGFLMIDLKHHCPICHLKIEVTSEHFRSDDDPSTLFFLCPTHFCVVTTSNISFS